MENKWKLSLLIWQRKVTTTKTSLFYKLNEIHILRQKYEFCHKPSTISRIKIIQSRKNDHFVCLLSNYLLKSNTYTANLCNQSATVVQLIVAITATFSVCNFWLQSLQIIGCKVKVHLLQWWPIETGRQRLLLCLYNHWVY